MTTTTEALRIAREALTWMHDMAAGGKSVGHLYEGDCPDDSQPDSRDPGCPACKAMDKARAALSAIDQAPSVEPVAQPGAVDYAALLQAAEAHKYRQGTGACIAFKRGAEWQASRATPQAQPATPPAVQAPRWVPVTDRYPDYAEDRRIVCYCDGYDYGGTSIITLKAAEFYEAGEDDGEPGNRESRTVSHWIAEDDLLRWITAGIGAAAQGGEHV